MDSLTRKDIKKIVKSTFESELNFTDIQDLTGVWNERLDIYKSKLSFAIKCLRGLSLCEAFSDFSETIADEIIDEIRQNI